MCKLGAEEAYGRTRIETVGQYVGLSNNREEGENVLSCVVTRNETWWSHKAPKSKQQSMEWRHTSLPTKSKFRQTTSAGKIMCTMFWDRKGILPVNFLS